MDWTKLGVTPDRWLANHKLCMLKDEEDAFLSKYKKLNEAVVGVIEDYSLVSFIPLHVEVRCQLWHVSLSFSVPLFCQKTVIVSFALLSLILL